ncbi:MAG: hypothetical protein JSV97_11725 [candidate division WOR-3 bacterium]|nr:MAG: hypothetical protein JSV97_11725 [candidate division WOR-3 bacterium]
MRRSEFEDILIQETPFYKELQKEYRDTATFSRYITVLKTITKSDGFVKLLEQRGAKALIFLGRKVLSLQEEFVVNYQNFLIDESRRDKWEEFFERYSKNLFEIYEKFVDGSSERALIFEIVNRKLLRDLLTKHIGNVPRESKMLIAERFGLVINQLFNYFRNSLARSVHIVDSLIIDVYNKIPLLPICSRKETMQLLSKNFLQNGLPEPLFTAMFKSMVDFLYTEEWNKIVDTINRKTTLSKDEIHNLFKSYFFFPDDDHLSEILKLLKKKSRELVGALGTRKKLIEDKIVEIKKRMRMTAHDLSKNLIDLANDFSTEEPIDTMIKRLRRAFLKDAHSLKNLKHDHQECVRIETELYSIMKFNVDDLSKFVVKNEWDPYLILILNEKTKIDEAQFQTILKDVMAEIRNDKEASSVLNKYRTGGFLKEKYDIETINIKFHAIMKGIIVSLLKSFLLEELMEYYPKLSRVVSPEGIRYVAEETTAGRVLMIDKDIDVIKESEEVANMDVSRFKNLVSVLIYDIRGSTFMGTKLKDAKKESEIRNLFQESMLAIVEKHGGVPIKDTGDGGIVLFTENSYDIRNHKTTKMESGSTLSAVRSGIEMIQETKNFVQENITKYQDWFREAEERKINFEGVTYAKLPPSYQAIFQVGVGIASGSYPKEVYLEKNAFGEYDLAGMLVREANLYSKVKAKEKSTVICDDVTVYNLLLNVNKFSFLGEAGLKVDALSNDIEQGLKYWITQKTTRRGFVFDLYKVFATQLGQEVSHPGSIKIVLGLFDISINEAGEIKDEKGGRGKFLYELSSEALG